VKLALVVLAALVAVNGAASQSAKPSAVAADRPAERRLGQRNDWLVSPAWLAGHMHDANLVLLHIGDKDEFQKEHIPGAQFLPLSDISTPHDMTNNSLMLELPPVAQLKETFETRGISNDSRIVVYFGKDTVSPATRVVWTLTYVGLGDRVSLLDGGMPAWRDAGHAITSVVKSPARGRLTPQLHPEILADAKYVAGHLHQPSVALIDVRLARDYAGEETPRSMGRRGHIPGASNLPMETLIDDHAKLKDASALEEQLRGAGVKPGSQVVSYCYIGQRATVTWFVARLLGYDAKMYDGSWDEWSKRNDLAIEGPAAKQP
jgi:thiosulfate/3-mercaptopyruvate sulfurtransferase